MNSFYKFSIFLFVVFMISSCDNGASPRQLAKELCDCVKSGENKLNYDGIKNKEVKRCSKKVYKKIIHEIKTREGNSRKQFIKSLIKSIVDTDCFDKVLEMLPYQLLKENEDYSDLDDYIYFEF